MIFLTVGTEFPFDRLVCTIDQMIGDGVITEPVFAQIGHTGFKPRYMRWVETLDRELYTQKVKDCKAIISHAGMGTIIAALKLDKPLLVMPRLKKYAEVVNDHQIETARQFGLLGHVLVAHNTRELAIQLKKLTHFRPRKRQVEQKLIIDYIRAFLENA